MTRRSARAACSVLALATACATPSLRHPPATTVQQGATTTRPVEPPMQDYLALVASESVDEIAVLRFGPKGISVERKNRTGIMPADVDGPHGVAVSPDGKYYYVTTAHGTPFGFLWKYALANDSLAGRVMLGNFPATMQITPDGEFAYVVNFNLHGEMVPSNVSIVATGEMVEVARVPTCTMPHGSRINAQGTKQYSACMMDDAVVEIDTRTFAVARHFMLKQGAEHGMAGAPRVRGAAGHDAGGHGMEPPKPGDVGCSPTWAQPSADGARLFVACNKSSDIVEIDVSRWAMTRRITTGAGVYNLAVTRDGTKLIGTNKRGQSVSVIDIASGRELARLPTKRRVVHGVVVSPDDRYAFVSVEGVGSEPGTVEVVDLVALKTVATVDIGQMAGGIDFWRMEPSR
jgi:DNA-binding beta-propeller fold protein YncE